jgi:RecB family endonuclease NucS
LSLQEDLHGTPFRHKKAEARLRAYIAANLGSIEPGLRPLSPNSEEFSCHLPGLGRVGGIDILAVDSLQRLVVIEVKSKPADPSALGQLVGYVAWLRKHLDYPTHSVRTIILAPSATVMLTYALETFDLFPVAFHKIDNEVFQLVESHRVGKVASVADSRALPEPIELGSPVLRSPCSNPLRLPPARCETSLDLPQPSAEGAAVR